MCSRLFCLLFVLFLIAGCGAGVQQSVVQDQLTIQQPTKESPFVFDTHVLANIGDRNPDSMKFMKYLREKGISRKHEGFLYQEREKNNWEMKSLQLNKQGFRFEEVDTNEKIKIRSKIYNFYSGNQQILENIYDIRSLQVNTGNVVFVASMLPKSEKVRLGYEMTKENTPNLLYHNGRIQGFIDFGGRPPVLQDNTLYQLEYRFLSSLADHRILRKNGEGIYHFTAPFYIESPIKNFFVDSSGWWLSYIDSHEVYSGNVVSLASTGVLIHNGDDINQKHSRDNIFHVKTIQDKPFFFIQNKKSNKISYQYDGVVYDTPFSDIIHDKCCEPAMLNIITLSDGINFFAKEGGQRVYVEMTLKD